MPVVSVVLSCFTFSSCCATLLRSFVFGSVFSTLLHFCGCVTAETASPFPFCFKSFTSRLSDAGASRQGVGSCSSISASVQVFNFMENAFIISQNSKQCFVWIRLLMCTLCFCWQNISLTQHHEAWYARSWTWLHTCFCFSFAFLCLLLLSLFL